MKQKPISCGKRCVLLESNAIQINQPDENGTTPLCIACQNGHLNIVRVLLESNAIQLNDSMNNGATPLIIATYLGQSSIVQALLSNDNIDLSRTFEDKTALQYSESHVRVASWSFLDDQINEEGRLACQELFSSL